MLRRHLDNLRWWLAYRLIPRHRHHIIRTTLRPGYYDPCMRLESALFDVTQEFWDYTKNVVDWYWNQQHAGAGDAFEAATEFWKANRKLLQEGGSSPEEMKKVDQLREQAQEHLLAIVKYLGHMWYP
jgi:hypothetical protein